MAEKRQKLPKDCNKTFRLQNDSVWKNKLDFSIEYKLYSKGLFNAKSDNKCITISFTSGWNSNFEKTFN